MNNTTDNTGVAATTLEAIVQETFELYVRGIHRGYSMLMIFYKSSVQYSVATSNISEPFALED